MTTDFRALCAELLDELEYQTDWSTAESLKAKARAALADEPAVPQGREPATADLEKEFRYWWKETYGSPYFGTVPLVAVLLWTECVLARWGNSAPQPPADGEVAELTGQLIEAANGAAAMGWDQHARSILRAAELLQRPMADLSPTAYALLTLAAELDS